MRPPNCRKSSASAPPTQLNIGEGTNLIVNYVPPEMTNGALKQLFEAYGTVVRARVIHDRETGHTKGYGFVKFTKHEDAAKAKAALDGFAIYSKRLKVNFAYKFDTSDAPETGATGTGQAHRAGGQPQVDVAGPRVYATSIHQHAPRVLSMPYNVPMSIAPTATFLPQAVAIPTVVGPSAAFWPSTYQEAGQPSGSIAILYSPESSLLNRPAEIANSDTFGTVQNTSPSGASAAMMGSQIVSAGGQCIVLVSNPMQQNSLLLNAQSDVVKPSLS